MGENETPEFEEKEAINPPQNLMLLGGDMSAGLLEVGAADDPTSVPALIVDLKLGILLPTESAIAFAEALANLTEGFRVIKTSGKPRLAAVPKELH